jgi:predicted aspartyl protease
MRRISSLSVVASALAAVCLAASAASQTPPGAANPGETASDTIGFEQFRRRMTVPIRIGDNGPYPFVVDTGAERTVISNELARKLALGPGKSVRMHSMTGVGEVETALIPHLDMSRKRMSGIHAPVLREAFIGASGILGTDMLVAQRVDFDFAQQTMSVTPSRATRPPDDPDTIVVTARSRFGRLVLVDADLEGEKVIVVLDTGSDVTIGNEALRRRLARKGKLKPTLPIGLVSVTGGTLTADYTQVDRMRLGNVTIRQMPIGFAEVHPFKQLELTDRPAMLLGMDALASFSKVSVDFARKKVSFLVAEPYDRKRRQLALR